MSTGMINLRDYEADRIMEISNIGLKINETKTKYMVVNRENGREEVQLFSKTFFCIL